MVKSLDALNKLWETEISQKSFPFLYELFLEYEHRKPFGGSKILHSIPCSIEAACKALILSIGGAEVVVRSMEAIIPASQNHAIDILESAGIRYIGTHLPKEESFDIHFDCSGDLSHLPPPRLGAIELTQSGSMIYLNKSLKYPVFSIDLSQIKMIETYMGTGESFTRAFQTLLSEPPSKHTFLVFGCGKVGSGVIHHLKSAGARIYGVDVNDTSLNQVRDECIATTLLSDKSAVLEMISNSSCIVTATGVPDFVSNHFTPSLFDNKILTNIGAEDEFGPLFSEQRVVNRKQPINFALADPTVLHYLDPVFYTHNKVAELFITQSLPPGVHPIPKEFDQSICQKWQELHKENLPFLERKKVLASSLS